MLRLQVKSEILVGWLHEAFAGRHVCSLCRCSLNNSESVGPLGGTTDTNALSLLFAANSYIVEDGVRVVQVGRTGGNFKYPLLVELTCLERLAEVLHPGVTPFNSDRCEFAGSPLTLRSA